MGPSSLFKRIVNKVLPSSLEQARLIRQAKRVTEAWRELLSNRGEVSGAAVAREAILAFRGLSAEAKPLFFTQLTTTLVPDEALVSKACQQYLSAPSAAHLSALQSACESPLQKLFRRLNQAPDGIETLMSLRKNVILGLKQNPEWQLIDEVLDRLFNLWFNRGFLSLQRIDWHTPAFVLEKLIEYEAVHEISGWRDLRRRLQSDRRCFGFFHPALPDEPLIFIEVALTKGISAAIGPLLDLEAPVGLAEKADTAVFYSITNCQPGLKGVSFGNLLIKQVAQKLGEEFPRIKTFTTLSPIPGFTQWLTHITPELEKLPDVKDSLQAIATLSQPDWHLKFSNDKKLKESVMALCAYYLTKATQQNLPADSVARFHLGNGARAERLNWLADVSPRGLKNCAGMMVNYVYHLNEIEQNHEAYVKGSELACTRVLRQMAQTCPLARQGSKDKKN